MTDPHETSATLCYLSAEEILERLEGGTVTSLEVVDTCLDRIAALDGAGTVVALNSIAAISADARQVARERDEERSRGESRGALHGVPVLIKDNIEAVGLPGLAGSTALVGRPSRDAGVVTRLREAGAILLASTNLSQWANIRSQRSTSGYSASGGLVANPWALDRSAGGSSSGSGAALAAGLAPRRRHRDRRFDRLPGVGQRSRRAQAHRGRSAHHLRRADQRQPGQSRSHGAKRRRRRVALQSARWQHATGNLHGADLRRRDELAHRPPPDRPTLRRGRRRVARRRAERRRS